MSFDNKQKEYVFPDDIQLITTTDLDGVITYVNDYFVEVSGYSREELIGQHHNVIRHPDMPRKAFESLWSTIQSGRSWKGLVKNRCKNGDYYWVDAFVSPISMDGKAVGYQSVRTQPTKDSKERAAKVYSTLDRDVANNKTAHYQSFLSFSTQVGVALYSPLLLAALIVFFLHGWKPAVLGIWCRLAGCLMAAKQEYKLLWIIMRPMHFKR